MSKTRESLEERLKPLIENNLYFQRAFGEKIVEIKGESFSVHRDEQIKEWNKDDLNDFEQKIIALENAKADIDQEAIIEKPLRERRLEYYNIDRLLLEAIAEKEEGRPEKMVEYLRLRNEIREKYPKA
tara:strand:+ start:1036 stop:1419 length:384 start_codon:yes stop_codon:yes gene_type:complete